MPYKLNNFLFKPDKIIAFLGLEVNNNASITKVVRYLKQISQTLSCLFDVREEASLYGKFFNSEELNRK